MEIRHLNTFKEIVETVGFTKAADKLGYTQSTITSHIKSLEDELSQPLFDRIGKQVILTETEKQLLPYANQMLQLYKDIKEVTSINGEVAGEIVISAPEAMVVASLIVIMVLIQYGVITLPTILLVRILIALILVTMALSWVILSKQM